MNNKRNKKIAREFLILVGYLLLALIAFLSAYPYLYPYISIFKIKSIDNPTALTHNNTRIYP